MNDILLSVLSIIVTAIIIPLLTLIGTKLTKCIESNTVNTQSTALLTQATTIVVNVVKSVTQTYVDSLKQSGSFDLDAQKTALSKAKEAALTQMNDQVKTYLSNNYGDIDSWLTHQIESTINSLKNKKDT